MLWLHTDTTWIKPENTDILQSSLQGLTISNTNIHSSLAKHQLEADNIRQGIFTEPKGQLWLGYIHQSSAAGDK